MTRVFLIGYRGVGKTTVARLLAERLGWEWCDADEVLERAYGKTIRSIFETEGEPSFRDKESATLSELSLRQRCVIATGGGVILRPENRELLKRGAVVWLAAEPETAWQRMQTDSTTGERRPNLAQGGLAEVAELIARREPLYRECAGLTVDTTHVSPEAAAEVILRWLN